MDKKTKLYNLLLPNKGINVFVYSVMVFGILSGSIFLMISSSADKGSVVNQIKNFLVNLNNIDSGLALRNSLIINYIFIVGIFILGFSIFGIVIGIFLLYLRGFLFGFSLSGIFLTYKYKGILFGVLYAFGGSVLNILLVILISIYSIMFSKYLIKVITSRKSVNNRVMLKKYLIIFLGCIVFSFVSSLLEVYLFPYLLGLVRGLYV